jgi:Domain of unknown function (DUF4129)
MSFSRLSVQLEKLAIVLRPRNAWEAVDLGYAMVQEWWRPVMKAWLVVYLPAALIINLLCWNSPLIAAVILWWLKPAFDRVVLYVLSGAAFGAVPTVRETLGALKRLWWKNGLFAALTYTRINFARSFTLPVVQLEGSRGKFAGERRKILGREGRGPAVMLTIICLCLEVTMVLSLYLLINLFSPGEPLIDLSWRALTNPEDSRATQYFTNFVGALTVSILEPFYVAGGFALYLNCRTAIEGWDVELTFKRLAARVAEKAAVLGKRAMASTVQISALAVACVLALALFSIEPAMAGPDAAASEARKEAAKDIAKEAADGDSPKDTALVTDDDKEDDKNDDKNDDKDPAPPNPKTPKAGAADAVKKVLEGKEFGEYTKGWELRYVGPTWDREKKKETNSEFSWLRQFATFVAESVRALAWIAGALLVLFLLYLIARHVGVNGWGKAKARDLPDVLFGLDVRPESLPDDLPAGARRFLEQGDLRAAVGLLYRGALVALIQDGRIDIARGDTELECVARVRHAYRLETTAEMANKEVAPAESSTKPDYFQSLVTIWQRVAYARERVPAAQVTALIDAWPAHFQIQRATAGSAGKRAREHEKVAA